MDLKRKNAQVVSITSLSSRGQLVHPSCFLGDEALAVALKADDPGAMETFYNRYAGYVQRILASIVNVDMDLAELLQEVFVQAFSSVGSLRDKSRLKSWLSAIAVNTARKHINKNTKWFLMSRDDPDSGIHSWTFLK